MRLLAVRCAKPPGYSTAISLRLGLTVALWEGGRRGKSNLNYSLLLDTTKLQLYRSLSARDRLNT